MQAPYASFQQSSARSIPRVPSSSMAREWRVRLSAVVVRQDYSDLRYCGQIGDLLVASDRATASCCRSRPTLRASAPCRCGSTERAARALAAARSGTAWSRCATRSSATPGSAHYESAGGCSARVGVGEAAAPLWQVAHCRRRRRRACRARPRRRRSSRRRRRRGSESWYACSAGSLVVTRSSLPLVTFTPGARFENVPWPPICVTAT